MSLSSDKRYEIVFLSYHPMEPKLGVKPVAKVKSTVQYWLNRWKESKDLSDSKRTGRPLGTTEKIDQRISDLATDDNSATTRDIRRVLKRQHVEISQETIRRRLKEHGAKFSPPISKPLLTEKHRQKRLQWAQAVRGVDWNRIVFTDETTVRQNQLKRCVWNLLGKRKVFRTVKYPVKVDLWGCFSCSGFGHIYCFRENLKADLLCKIYKRCLLPTARDHFGRNATDWELQIQSICPALQNNGDRTIQFKELIGHPCHQT